MLHWIAFGAGAGLFPRAPGTAGTVVAIPIYLAIATAPLAVHALVVAIVIGVGIWAAIHRTRPGKLLIAVIHDREIASALGINVARFFTVTFLCGAVLGALGGALSAPLISVVPGIGVELIVLAFAVVVIGGLGSVEGAAIGALLVGLGRTAAVFFRPELELFVVFVVMTVVLAVRPEGLFGKPQTRRI